MSKFWNASQPPKEADIVGWCEKEVETACLDLVGNMKVMGWMSLNGEHFLAAPYVGGDWELDLDDGEETLASLLREGAEAQVSWVHDATNRGIYGHDRDRVDLALQEIEAVIAEVRAWLKDGPRP